MTLLMANSRTQRAAPTVTNGAHEMYVTYDVEDKSRGQSRVDSVVKPIYVSGRVREWRASVARNRTGQDVYGVLIKLEQEHKSRRKKMYLVRGGRISPILPASVYRAVDSYTQMVELPVDARNVKVYESGAAMPLKYQRALQRGR